MPRGGNGKPDGFSPYKATDGRELRLLKSTNSQTGYYRVIKVHNKFYPKAKLDGEKNSGKQKTFGKGQETPRLAAIVLAEYTAAPYELTKAPPRHPRSTSEAKAIQKKHARLEELSAEAQAILASLAPEKTLEEMAAEDARMEAEEAAYMAWRESRGERVELGVRQRVQAAPPEPVAAPFQFDADALASAARATAAPPAAM